ncbi:MAG: LapA family protein [Moraxellaceae bacterium]|nr:MAG: LapA family protein [Moraxellaceae bacterium]
MSVKTIIAIIIAVLITIVIMQNNDPVRFNILFSTLYASKLVVMSFIAVAAFILGLIVGRPKKPKYDIEAYHDSHNTKGQPGTLSDEDRDYIN